MALTTTNDGKPIPLLTRIACWFSGHVWTPDYGFTVFMGWGCRTKTCVRCQRTYFQVCVGSDGEEGW